MAANLSLEKRGRIAIDVTSLTRWSGPPVGIIRVLHALATAEPGDCARLLVAYDSARQQFRALAPEWAATVLSWSGLIDPHIPAAFPRNLVSRHAMVMTLERVRLTTRASLTAWCVSRLQRAVLAVRAHGFPLRDSRGARIAVVSSALAFGPEFQPGPDDILLLAGMSWFYLDIDQLRALKAKSGCRLATICYDLIPITHPEFFQATDRKMFEKYWRDLPVILDHVLFSAKTIQADFERWCTSLSLALPGRTIVDFGYDPPPPPDLAAALPAELKPRRFALFVSTIEPRKGHATLLAAWRRVTARSLPSVPDFKLVFVGRPGWLVDEVLEQLLVPPPGVVHLAVCSDAELAGLYQNAAFCCYPSRYEGFGLPLIEAFARGKAVLSSSGGALRETAGNLAQCLDPLDVDAWDAALTAWIMHPELVEAAERQIADSFRHPNWAEAARGIFARLSELSR